MYVRILSFFFGANEIVCMCGICDMLKKKKKTTTTESKNENNAAAATTTIVAAADAAIIINCNITPLTTTTLYQNRYCLVVFVALECLSLDCTSAFFLLRPFRSISFIPFISSHILLYMVRSFVFGSFLTCQNEHVEVYRKQSI